MDEGTDVAGDARAADGGDVGVEDGDDGLDERGAGGRRREHVKEALGGALRVAAQAHTEGDGVGRGRGKHAAEELLAVRRVQVREALLLRRLGTHWQRRARTPLSPRRLVCRRQRSHKTHGSAPWCLWNAMHTLLWVRSQLLKLF